MIFFKLSKYRIKISFQNRYLKISKEFEEFVFGIFEDFRIKAFSVSVY